MSRSPSSCDTFVILPPDTAKGCVIFGKNSDRPNGEVQEVIYCPAADHPDDEKLQCTYIEVPECSHTLAVILSKPAWMWGAEMGANEKGLCIGNEAVWTKKTIDKTERLLGMDLVRLGLERGSTAREALDIITSLLEQHGQGGPCSDSHPDMSYHNSFLIVDPKEAWVLETAGNLWAAERITSGFRNISNCLTIGTKMDLTSPDLAAEVEKQGLWDSSKGPLNFSQALEDSPDTQRFTCGKELLQKLCESGEFREQDMFSILRDTKSGICMSSGYFVSASSQVSVLGNPDSSRPCCHWFTGTPDPLNSVFKPFIFGPKVRISPHIVSPKFDASEDPAKVTPRFVTTVDRRHLLYKHHERAYDILSRDSAQAESLRITMTMLEAKCVKEMEVFLDNFNSETNLEEVEDLFKDIVETEIKFYK